MKWLLWVTRTLMSSRTRSVHIGLTQLGPLGTESMGVVSLSAIPFSTHKKKELFMSSIPMNSIATSVARMPTTLRAVGERRRKGERHCHGGLIRCERYGPGGRYRAPN